MNYIKITKYDVANGEGVRCCLWVAGCTLRCEGCHNKDTWGFAAGKPFDEEALMDLLEGVSKPWISGLTITGGHPLEKQNISEVKRAARIIKKFFPKKTIWLYTGWIWEDIIKDTNILDLLECVDVVVDGAFIADKKNLSLRFRGSSNQRIIDVKNSLSQNKVVLYMD